MQGKDRHRRGGPRSFKDPHIGGEEEGSGGGGKVKVREISDLLGVSKSLMRPPLRSWRKEKGLRRTGVPTHGLEAGVNRAD